MANKSFLKILVVIIILAIGSGGIWAWQYWRISKEKSVVEEKPVASEETETKVVENFFEKKLDWKIYKNEKYGFEIKYPGNLNIEQPGADVFIVKGEGIEYLQVQYSLTISPPKDSRPINDGFISYRPNNADFVSIVNIGGKEANKYYTDNPIGEGATRDMPYTCYVVVLDVKEWLQIEYYGDKESADLFESIISTFRFLE